MHVASDDLYGTETWSLIVIDWRSLIVSFLKRLQTHATSINIAVKHASWSGNGLATSLEEETTVTGKVLEWRAQTGRRSVGWPPIRRTDDIVRELVVNCRLLCRSRTLCLAVDNDDYINKFILIVIDASVSKIIRNPHHTGRGMSTAGLLSMESKKYRSQLRAHRWLKTGTVTVFQTLVSAA